MYLSILFHEQWILIEYNVDILGDRLTDERVQSAQSAFKNAATPKEKLEGFFSKTEDFHRLMNFLEVFFTSLVIFQVTDFG